MKQPPRRTRGGHHRDGRGAAVLAVLLVQIAGIVGSVHVPCVIALTLPLNRTRLPKALLPGTLSLLGSALPGLFFIGFAALFIPRKTGLIARWGAVAESNYLRPRAGLPNLVASR
ncbi:hypothetical protein CLV84_0869 [Neolewinella xylanilytica]|uniref:Uncharacterized protein n=1 Tax=Neolewinella xylanilytica TaxID=1514080 RepID=A0A2S6I8T3_9BACT|nr:hypothetical protein [Neolewinella xylanilytica]PPK87910.1 hypothetical protein CLV84_0869 [Neolewinella xylanilytica]